LDEYKKYEKSAGLIENHKEWPIGNREKQMGNKKKKRKEIVDQQPTHELSFLNKNSKIISYNLL
jgi:hypothetical protein